MTVAQQVVTDAAPGAQIDGLGARLREILADLKDEYNADHDYPWIIGFSGGKDSTALVQLVFEMLLALPPRQRTRRVHVVANDTLVESPVIASHLDAVLERIGAAIRPLNLPVTVAKTVPQTDQTFWVNLIGRGYPSPSRMFRWCTDRMKIRPTTEYIRRAVDEAGRCILLIGVRRAESQQRQRSFDRYANGERLNPHNSLQGCMVYRPIVELTTEEVWQTLLQSRPPWGGSHRDLVTLYRNAGAGECPLVTDKSDAPSCGTSSSRFGCWTCTVVEKDKSAESFIDSGRGDLEPLLEFRDWLKALREDTSKRMATRRNGSLNFVEGGRLIPGPFTLEARREVLARLLAMQEDVGVPLIGADEVAVIHRIWAEDAAFRSTRGTP